MKSIVAPYATAAWCVRIECVGGLVVRLTSYPVNLTMATGEVYQSDAGYETTAYSGSATMAASAIDIEGIANIAGVGADDIAAGIFDNARVYIFKCNFLAPVEDYEPVAAGLFGKVSLEDEHYRIEGMSLIDVLGQSVGKTYTAACSHTFGDARCGIDLSSIAVVGSITHVTNAYSFRDSSRTEAADWFAYGSIRFTSGANAGHKALEIKSHAADGSIATFEPFYYTPEIGDDFIIVPGCRKRLSDCRDKWNNVIHFFGFSNIPTGSTYASVGGQ